MSGRKPSSDASPARVDPIRAGLLCRCPRCGRGRLFAGFLKVADTCADCGADFSRLNTGDGAAVFIMQISGGLAVLATLAVQLALAPPFWVLFVVALPLMLGAALGLMRPGKGLMIALQMRETMSDSHQP